MRLSRDQIIAVLDKVVELTMEDVVTEDDDTILLRADELKNLLEENWTPTDFVEIP